MSVVSIYSYARLAELFAYEKSGAIETEDEQSDEWLDWYRMTPAERWEESQKLWPTYLALGGSLDPEPDSESPFDDPQAWRESIAHGRPGVRVLRRGGV
jgi:hypothetical protein